MGNLLDLFNSFFVAVLSGFLAFSGTLATEIEGFLALSTDSPQSTVVLEDTEKEREIPKNEGVEAESDTAEEEEELPPPPPVTIDPEDIAPALANVACSLTAGGKRRISTGSGVFIDERGVVLTNAHVAQFLLMKNQHEDVRASCIIRTGDPAIAKYDAELIYISPNWIREHASLINDRAPLGSGADDFALLRVSGARDGHTLPEIFPHLSINQEELAPRIKGEDVFVAGYPSQESDGEKTTTKQTIARSSVHRLYGFTESFIDLISVSSIGTDGKGSSGGPIVSTTGDVIGLITTQGGTTPDGEATLRALTIDYINRSITSETSFTIENLLSSDLALRADIFEASLTSFLGDELIRELLEE